MAEGGAREERLRREQANKVKEELDFLRNKTQKLEVEKTKLQEEVEIWKNAQTAASALIAPHSSRGWWPLVRLGSPRRLRAKTAH